MLLLLLALLGIEARILWILPQVAWCAAKKSCFQMVLCSVPASAIDTLLILKVSVIFQVSEEGVLLFKCQYPDIFYGYFLENREIYPSRQISFCLWCCFYNEHRHGEYYRRQDFRLSRQWIFRLKSSGLWCRTVLR